MAEIKIEKLCDRSFNYLWVKKLRGTMWNVGHCVKEVSFELKAVCLGFSILGDCYIFMIWFDNHRYERVLFLRDVAKLAGFYMWVYSIYVCDADLNDAISFGVFVWVWLLIISLNLFYSFSSIIWRKWNKAILSAIIRYMEMMNIITCWGNKEQEFLSELRKPEVHVFLVFSSCK